MNKWFFDTVGDQIFLCARLESDDGTVGDARSVLSVGGQVKNLTFEELKRAGAGSIVIEGETARIVEEQHQ